MWQILKQFDIAWQSVTVCDVISDRRERRNPRHPEVGRSPAPNFANVTSKVGSRDRKHVPKPSNVRIFNDTAYIKAARVSSKSLGIYQLTNSIYFGQSFKALPSKSLFQLSCKLNL